MGLITCCVVLCTPVHGTNVCMGIMYHCNLIDLTNPPQKFGYLGLRTWDAKIINKQCHATHCHVFIQSCYSYNPVIARASNFTMMCINQPVW